MQTQMMQVSTRGSVWSVDADHTLVEFAAKHLTIRGTTREVVLDVTYEGRGHDPSGVERLSFSADTKIDRRDFGLTWNQALETGGVLVGNEIRIWIEVQATRG